MLIALTRSLAPSIADCQLTFMDREPIDVRRAAEQHDAYREALGALGAEVVNAPGGVDLPDSVFIEDTALVLAEVAILASMTRPSRRPETNLTSQLLATQREVVQIQPPGMFEGGDAFLVGRTIYVGLSTRTNQAGVEQLRAAVEPIGYRVTPVAVTGCLHLTTGAMRVGDGLVLANPQWVDAGAFALAGVEVIPVDPAEPWAANALPVGGETLMGDCFGRTRHRVEAHGLCTRTIDIGELMKAEAGLTCMSLIFEGDPAALRSALPEPTDVAVTAGQAVHPHWPTSA